MARPRTRSDEEVLAAAARVVLARGPHAFTLADVAREAGLAAPTLVQRFGSKRGLLVAIGRGAAARAGAPFDAAVAAAPGPLAALRAALGALAGDLRTRTELANSLAFLLEDVRDPDLRRAAAAHARATEARVRALLEAAAAAGELAADDPAALARTVYAAWNGALVQWALRGEGPLPAWIDAVLAPLLRPARRPPPAAGPGGAR